MSACAFVSSAVAAFHHAQRHAAAVGAAAAAFNAHPSKETRRCNKKTGSGSPFPIFSATNTKNNDVKEARWKWRRGDGEEETKVAPILPVQNIEKKYHDTRNEADCRTTCTRTCIINVSHEFKKGSRGFMRLYKQPFSKKHPLSIIP
jgi:hypothetical protein